MRQWKISQAKFESDLINPALAVSPWNGHRNFVYDLLPFLRPDTIVELGTHYGCSFFAMCQSLKDNETSSRIYAVDTWEGDEQAGFYGNEVWETVSQTLTAYFGSVSAELLRMRFEDAVFKFKDESIDLIHIDGLHTYEAVQRDFTTWLPKLKKNGVVLFHDVNSDLGYGTNRYWEELKQEYDCYFEFEHSWGLGVLFPKGNELYTEMVKAGFEDKRLIYTYRALYEYECIKTSDLTKMVDERDKAIKSQAALIDERDKTIRSQTALIDARDEDIRAQTAMIDERDKTIRSQTALIDARDEDIRAQTALIDARDEEIRAQTAMIDERDKTIRSQTALIDERDKTIKSQTALIDERDKTIKSQAALIDARDEDIRAQAAMIDERDKTIRSQAAMIDERDKTIRSQAALIDAREEDIRAQTAMIDERDKTIRSQAEMIDARDETIRSQTALIDARDEAIRAQAAMIDARDEAIRAQAEMIDARDKTIREQEEKLSGKE